MTAKFFDRLSFERELWLKNLSQIAGVDEAGRGPLAGPVVAAAVVLPQGWRDNGFDERLRDLNDSKQLTEAQRDGRMAAAATTGPASGPLPASSTPATRRIF